MARRDTTRNNEEILNHHSTLLSSAKSAELVKSPIRDLRVDY